MELWSKNFSPTSLSVWVYLSPLFLTNVSWRYLAVEIKILKKEALRVEGRSLETEVIPLVDKLK